MPDGLKEPTWRMKKKLWSKLAKPIIEELEVDRKIDEMEGQLFFEDRKVSTQKDPVVKVEIKENQKKHSRFEHDKLKKMQLKPAPAKLQYSVDDIWDDGPLDYVSKPKPFHIHPGMSYRPTSSDHDELLNKVANEELKKEYLYAPKKEVTLIPEQVSLEKPIEPAINNLKVRKIKKERNKEIVEKYEENRRQQKLFHRKILKQLDNLPDLIRRVKIARTPQSKNRFKRIRDNVKIGKFFLNDPTPVQLKEDIPSTLRQLPQESNALKNVYMSLLKKEKIDYSKYRLNRKTKRVKTITKSSFRLN
eukprot:NODE_112_length_19362_cov_0.399678.p8 type:complete len:304 gc:universal NODE_112_length_19362_cov_0.399678:18691-17780(-)